MNPCMSLDPPLNDIENENIEIHNIDMYSNLCFDNIDDINSIRIEKIEIVNEIETPSSLDKIYDNIFSN